VASPKQADVRNPKNTKRNGISAAGVKKPSTAQYFGALLRVIIFTPNLQKRFSAFKALSPEQKSHVNSDTYIRQNVQQPLCI
jgi:hypothetical protein